MADWTFEQKESLASLAPYFLGPVPAVAALLVSGVHPNEDMDAINQYMITTTPVTPEATIAAADWIAWWNTLSWYDKNISTEAYDTARNKFHDFAVANQPT